MALIAAMWCEKCLKQYPFYKIRLLLAVLLFAETWDRWSAGTENRITKAETAEVLA